MNKTNTNTNKDSLYTYVLTYYIDNDRMVEYYSTAIDAIDYMSKIGKGCVRRELLANVAK